MLKGFILSAFIISTLFADTQDRFFGRTYTTNILEKGNIDLEFWHTSRFGHRNQFFHAQDQRMEVEIGLGGNVQTAFYFNRFQKRFSTTDNGTQTSVDIGFSNEWKWKVLHESLNRIGLALYGEWSIKGGDEAELESKIIIDKSVGKSLFAFNGTVEYEKEFEWENGKLHSGPWKLPVEFDAAYLYNLSPYIGIGFEITNANEISKVEKWRHSVFFGGPTFNYRGTNWFVIANYLPQWGNIHRTDFAAYKVLDVHERAEVRILLGISLR